MPVFTVFMCQVLRKYIISRYFSNQFCLTASGSHDYVLEHGRRSLTAIIFVLTSAGTMHFHMDDFKVNMVSKLDEKPLNLSQTNYIYSALNYPKKDKIPFSCPEELNTLIHFFQGNIRDTDRNGTLPY